MATLDKIGQEIVPGCIIAHPVMRGQSAYMRISKVLAINTKKKSWSNDEETHLKVRGVEDWYSSPKLTEKAATLMYPDRVMVIPISTLPPLYQQLLDSVN